MDEFVKERFAGLCLGFEVVRIGFEVRRPVDFVALPVKLAGEE